MIANEAELGEARRRLGILEAGLYALRERLTTENPTLLPSVSAGYEHQIRTLRESIEAYEETQAITGAR